MHMANRWDVPPKKSLVRRLFVPDHDLTLPTTQTQRQAQAPSASSHSEWHSPVLKQRTNAEVNGGGTPKKQKCNCKYSDCLKLYCECIASGNNCDECNCTTTCHNNFKHEDAKREAVKGTLERNPNAFRSKIVGSPHGTKDREEDQSMKSECLKKYCDVNSNGYGSSPLAKRVKGLHLPQFQQEPPMNSSTLPPFLTAGPSRPLLADIIQPEDLRKLCSVLAANIVPEDKSEESNSVKENQTSSGTLANEKDLLNSSSKLHSSHAEQERAVLTKFRDCLNQIITVSESMSRPARPP